MIARVQEFDSPMPSRVIGQDGKPNFGRYCHPFIEVNLDTVALAPPIPGFPKSVAYGRFRLKEWQHFAIITPTIFVSFALVDSKFAQLAWCQVVDRRTGRKLNYERRGFYPGMHIARELSDDRCALELRNFSIVIDNHLGSGGHTILVDIKGDSKQQPNIRAQLRCEHDLSIVEPMVVVLPVGGSRAMYSHKVPLPVTGWLSVGEEEFALSAGNGIALVDIHKAHYPRHTWWHWATCAGYDNHGRLLALNLTHNVVENDFEHNENGFWENGRLLPLGPARFIFDAKDPLIPWRVHTLDGAVDLSFIPAGSRHENIRTGIVNSKFHQCYGTYSGIVRTEHDVIQLESFFGLAEIHESKW